MTGIEEYTIQHGKLHPEIVRVLQYYMKPPLLPMVFDPNEIRVQVVPPNDPRLLAGSRAVGMMTDSRNPRNTVMLWAKGAMNREGIVRGNSFDLAIPGGWWSLAHECHHCYRMPRLSWWERFVYAMQVWRWQIFGGDYHNTCFVEVEATKLGDEVSKGMIEFSFNLDIFKELRGANGKLMAYWVPPGDML